MKREQNSQKTGGAGAVMELTEAQRRARSIMGPHFISPAEVTQGLGLPYTEKDLRRLNRVPYKDETLRRLQETHILFPGISYGAVGEPLTIQKFKAIYPGGGIQPRFYRYDDFSPDQYYVTRETPNLRWYLIRKAVIPESLGKISPEHKKMLQKGEYLERAVVYIYMMLLWFEVRDQQRLFERHFLRCGNLIDGYARVFCGYFRPAGIRYFTWWDHLRRGDIGIAPAVRRSIFSL